MDGEDASLAGFALNGDASSVCLGNVFDDGESESCTAKLAAPSFVDPVKPLE